MSSAFSESEAALISSLGAQRDVEQYTVMVRELEKLLPLSAAYKDKAQGNDADEFLRSLPAAMLNMRDLLVHIAAKMEALHTRIEDAKVHFLGQQRAGGDYRNPFQDAEKRGKRSDDVARKSVSAIPPSTVWSQNAGQEAIGHAPTSSSPSAGQGILGASSNSTPGLFGGQFSGGSIFGQQPAGGFNTFNQLPKAPSRKTKAKK